MLYLLKSYTESLYLTFYHTFYWGIRFLVQLYLNTTKEDACDYIFTEREWLDDQNNLVKLLKVKKNGHIRSFILTDSLSLPYSVDKINWDEVIDFGNSILACMIENEVPMDVTEDIKRYAHYILYNYFFTVEDFVKITKSGELSDEYKFTIIYSDLEERQMTISRKNMMKELIIRNN
jgi:hypothetical protein